MALPTFGGTGTPQKSTSTVVGVVPVCLLEHVLLMLMQVGLRHKVKGIKQVIQAGPFCPFFLKLCELDFSDGITDGNLPDNTL